MPRASFLSAVLVGFIFLTTMILVASILPSLIFLPLDTLDQIYGFPFVDPTEQLPVIEQKSRIQSTSVHCPPMPPPGGNMILVDPSQARELDDVVQGASSGDTILLADGTYELHGDYLWFGTPGVTMRSASGNREAVIIDGNYDTTEIVTIAASNVTISDLTLRRARTHPIHVVSTAAGNVEDTLIYNVHIVDPGQQAIKINPGGSGTWPDNGVIACSRIELTDAGRPWVWTINGSCYTGGVDAHQARGWVVRDNLVEGFWCSSDLAEHGIHFWRGCRDTLVERNVLRDNARGIGFGLATSGSARTYADDPCPSAGGGYVDHYGGIVRNNFVFAGRNELFASQAGFDCGICLWTACGAQVVHNTVASTAAPFSSVEWRFANTVITLTNNLASHNLLARDGATAYLEGNLASMPLSTFVDGEGGDLHLAPAASTAIDQGVSFPVGLCDDDIDGDVRPAGLARDVGADEYTVLTPSAVTDLRVTEAMTSPGTLTATLRWTAPTGAMTTTLRYSGAPITVDNWPDALMLTNTLSGDADTFVTVVPYGGGTIYLCQRAQNVDGVWSAVSNNGFWPRWDVFLPLTMKQRAISGLSHSARWKGITRLVSRRYTP